jgi:nicotinamidase/pyrazinamidase
MTDTVQLLIIDPQNDFCDLPPARCPPGEAPALPVAGRSRRPAARGGFIDAMAAGGWTPSPSRWTATSGWTSRTPASGRPATAGGGAVHADQRRGQLRAGEFVPRDPRGLAARAGLRRRAGGRAAATR